MVAVLVMVLLVQVEALLVVAVVERQVQAVEPHQLVEEVAALAVTELLLEELGTMVFQVAEHKAVQVVKVVMQILAVALVVLVFLLTVTELAAVEMAVAKMVMAIGQPITRLLVVEQLVILPLVVQELQTQVVVVVLEAVLLVLITQVVLVVLALFLFNTGHRRNKCLNYIMPY
jgi:hypothetical protein